MHQNKFNPMERRPRLLKDFLNETSNSCSSSGFKSFPRKPICPASSSIMRTLIEMDLNSRNSNPSKLSSKSPFQTLVNAFKFKSISFSTVKSSSFLPRSLLRKLSRRNTSSRRENEKKGSEIKITVRIKDIVRWKSFRDLVEEQCPPLDFALSPQHCTTTSSSSSSCSSHGSSWSDSNFTTTSSYWDGNFAEVVQNDVDSGKLFSQFVGKGKDWVEATTGKLGYAAVRAKEVFNCQEEEGQSPVSVLDVGEDEFSPFDQTLGNIESKLMQAIHSHKLEKVAKLEYENLEQWLSLNENTEVERTARQLLNCVKAKFCSQSYEWKVVLDFLRSEVNLRRNESMEDEWEMVKIAQDWIDGSFVYEIEHMKEMDRRKEWRKFEEDERELASQIGDAILHALLNEFLLYDFP